MSSPTILIVFVNAGETWLEKTDPQANLNFLPYKFTAKELDEETGLYYYGARYLDPKYSMWISTDPALGEYIPKAPIDEEAKKYNQNLPGMGGAYNHINFNLYHYAGNNPVKFVDPDGRIIIDSDTSIVQQYGEGNLNNTTASIYDYGCTLTMYVRMANALGANVTLDEANSYAIENNIFSAPNVLSIKNGVDLVNGLLANSGIDNINISFAGSINCEELGDYAGFMEYYNYDNSSNSYFCTARLDTNGSNPQTRFGHSVNIPSDALLSYRCNGKFESIKIDDTSKVGRSQLYGDPSGRDNYLLRLDFFKINEVNNE